MKDPGHLAIDLQHQFVGQLKMTELPATISAKHFIVIAGDVNHAGAMFRQIQDLLDHLKVTGREITFAELPSIDDVAIQDQPFGTNVAEILNDFLSMATIGAQVEVRKYNDLCFSIIHGRGFV